MQPEVQRVTVWRISDEAVAGEEDVVARETPLTVIINDRELVTLLCSPVNLKDLAIGFLVSEGLLTQLADVKSAILDETRGIIRVTSVRAGEADEVFKRFISSGCGRGASFYSAADITGIQKVESKASMPGEMFFSLFKDFQHRSETYRSTGGVHSAALCDESGILLFAEDIGRHNAIDKIFGKCFLEGIRTEDRAVITSGRVSSEILLKVARRGIPIIASRSAPTDLGVKAAEDLGITLAGFVRGRRMNIYTNKWRITDGRR